MPRTNNNLTKTPGFIAVIAMLAGPLIGALIGAVAAPFARAYLGLAASVDTVAIGLAIIGAVVCTPIGAICGAVLYNRRFRALQSAEPDRTDS